MYEMDVTVFRTRKDYFMVFQPKSEYESDVMTVLNDDESKQ